MAKARQDGALRAATEPRLAETSQPIVSKSKPEPAKRKHRLAQRVPLLASYLRSSKRDIDITDDLRGPGEYLSTSGPSHAMNLLCWRRSNIWMTLIGVGVVALTDVATVALEFAFPANHVGALVGNPCNATEQRLDALTRCASYCSRRHGQLYAKFSIVSRAAAEAMTDDVVDAILDNTCSADESTSEGDMDGELCGRSAARTSGARGRRQLSHRAGNLGHNLAPGAITDQSPPPPSPPPLISGSLPSPPYPPPPHTLGSHLGSGALVDAFGNLVDALGQILENRTNSSNFTGTPRTIGAVAQAIDNRTNGSSFAPGQNRPSSGGSTFTPGQSRPGNGSWADMWRAGNYSAGRNATAEEVAEQTELIRRMGYVLGMLPSYLTGGLGGRMQDATLSSCQSVCLRAEGVVDSTCVDAIADAALQGGTDMIQADPAGLLETTCPRYANATAEKAEAVEPTAVEALYSTYTLVYRSGVLQCPLPQTP